jgi:hypothetical protein
MVEIVKLHRIEFLWAADLFLCSPSGPVSFRLASESPAVNLTREEGLSLLEIDMPLILKDFKQYKINKSWQHRMGHALASTGEQAGIYADVGPDDAEAVERKSTARENSSALLCLRHGRFLIIPMAAHVPCF